MHSYLKIFLLTVVLFSSTVFAEADLGYKNSFSVDVANVLTFLSKKKESYLLYYKRRMVGPHAIRSGLDLEWGNEADAYKIFSIKLGYEQIYPIVSKHWRVHWASDLSFRYSAANFMNTVYRRYGLTPYAGFSYFPVSRFSLSTEFGMNFFYIQKINEKSFAPMDNAKYWQVNVAAVGMVLLSYHF
ncbi:MAG: hypothetical protein GX116_04800 [Fibrobacter sp.]|jgi:hypothetical protein|nr:hypothetical protein [Fibrobacter sp.]